MHQCHQQPLLPRSCWALIYSQHPLLPPPAHTAYADPESIACLLRDMQECIARARDMISRFAVPLGFWEANIVYTCTHSTCVPPKLSSTVHSACWKPVGASYWPCAQCTEQAQGLGPFDQLASAMICWPPRPPNLLQSVEIFEH